MVYRLIFGMMILFCQGMETFHLSFDILTDGKAIFMYRYEDDSIKFTIDNEAMGRLYMVENKPSIRQHQQWQGVSLQIR